MSQILQQNQRPLSQPNTTNDAELYTINMRQQAPTYSEQKQQDSSQTQPILKSTDRHWILTLKRIPGKSAKDKTTKEIVITYTQSNNGTLTDMKYKIAKEKNSHKLSPNWIRNQRVDFIKNLLTTMFNIHPNCFIENGKKKEKKKIVQMAFDKLGFKITFSDTRLSFNNTELSDIRCVLDKIEDIDYELYHFLMAQERYLGHKGIRDVLDFVFEDCNFTAVIHKIWELFKRLLYKDPASSKFEKNFQKLYLNAMDFEEIKALKQLYDVKFNLADTYGINFSLFKGIIIRNMKILFIATLKRIIYGILDLENKAVKIGELTKYQIYCYCGAALCTILHIWYGSNMKQKDVYIYLTKLFCITPKHHEYKNIPLDLQYENKGYMYIMHPKLFAISKAILNNCWMEINKQYRVYKMIPDFNAVIAKYQQSEMLFNEFKKLLHNDDKSMYNSEIQELFQRYVKHSMSKVIYTSIDQLGLNEIGMSLRDKFKYEHIKNRQSNN